ncbi:hypothetical protein EWU23_08650 [Cytophagaceae bacterium 50C-KIRBA]|uniref:Uncharacterized protein n=1 Tax=Aquirufa beregesia TaxID=2516556 RepID=A0ABX0EWN9_9BACT|nr:hypothetical protein [Aquirufa beregesia]NGZ44543.1 hypothetical protein [Aquirufa beregesia]
MNNSKLLKLTLPVLSVIILGGVFGNDARGKETPNASCKKANQVCMDLPWPASDPNGVLVIVLD